MQVKSIDNPENKLTWDVRPATWPIKNQSSCRSKIQYLCGQLLRKKFPFDPILEDITIPGTRLSLDFFLPQRKKVFEIQGLQHDEINSFFHKTEADFSKQQERDKSKEFFCDLNLFSLVKIRSVKEMEEILGIK